MKCAIMDSTLIECWILNTKMANGQPIITIPNNDRSFLNEKWIVCNSENLFDLSIHRLMDNHLLFSGFYLFYGLVSEFSVCPLSMTKFVPNRHESVKWFGTYELVNINNNNNWLLLRWSEWSSFFSFPLSIQVDLNWNVAKYYYYCNDQHCKLHLQHAIGSSSR